MKELADVIMDIRRARDNNGLVFFIGAGISKNSGLPSWKELIEKIARKIGYIGKNNGDFYTEELLLIPEYFYNDTENSGHEEYFSFIRDIFNHDFKPNSIHDEIFKCRPHHIITTNYDSLLEKCTNGNTENYVPVHRDEDLLSYANDRYILKMHGDIEDQESIVLKKSDYINYEQNHIMISTFIKSLLINHTFVFIGYSMQDYNLQQILGWINYYSKSLEVKRDVSNYFITCDDEDPREKKRLERENVRIVPLSTLDANEIERIAVKSHLTCDAAKRIYAFLRYLEDDKIFSEAIGKNKVINQRFDLFESYMAVSFHDLQNNWMYGKLNIIGRLALNVTNDENENKIKNLFSDPNAAIVKAFRKSIIRKVGSYWNRFEPIQIEEEIEIDENFKLYLNNRYPELIEKCMNEETPEAIYYLCLCGANSAEHEEKIIQNERAVLKKNTIDILLHKVRTFLIEIQESIIGDERTRKSRLEIRNVFKTMKVQYIPATGFLKDVLEEPSKYYPEMENYMQKLEERYSFDNRTWYSAPPLDNLKKLQSYAYDYYFFIRKNCLPFDNTMECKAFMSYYIRAIFCTYSLVDDKESDSIFENRRNIERYEINDIDLDIIVKLSQHKDLVRYANKYHIEKIKPRRIEIEEKYKNLTDSITEGLNLYSVEQLKNFTFLLTILDVSDFTQSKCINAFWKMFCKVIKTLMFTKNLLEVAEMVTSSMRDFIDKDVVSSVIKALRSREIMSHASYEMWKRKITYIINSLADQLDEDSRQTLWHEIDNEKNVTKKTNDAYEIRRALPVNQRRNLFKADYTKLTSDRVLYLILEGDLEYDDKIYTDLVNRVRHYAREREEKPGYREYPDQLEIAINSILSLKIKGYALDIERLRPYIGTQIT